MYQTEVTERLALAVERIQQIPEEQLTGDCFQKYFAFVAKFLLLLEEQRSFLEGGGLKGASLEELARRNAVLYADIREEHYGESYANPDFGVQALGETFGPLLSFLYTEMRSMIGFVHEGRLWELAIRMELFLEVYGAFACAWQEQEKLPDYEEVRQIIYWFVSDYAEPAAKWRVKELVAGENDFAVSILRDWDLSDLRYLYAYGEYVSENELACARFLAELPQETIDTMADTYTEGYRKGFEVAGKPLEKKKVVEIRYQLGFERMICKAIENFAKMGLKPVIYRAAASILYNPSLHKIGFCGGSPNRQYEYDHKDDKALFLDRLYCNRRLEVMQAAYEECREEAYGYAGPAVVETFGERDFAPVNKKWSLRLSDTQNKLWVEYVAQTGELQRKYILPEERSYTIIAFPVPEIGDCFPELFRDIIRVNTLDYQKYQKIQQTLIDTLDRAVCCKVKGMGDNRTDLEIALHPLKDPKCETIFENCVADVNIPVGEVFTSPMLTGTKGLLHVSRVYLNGLEYRDLEITFADGKIRDYTCKNFASEEESKSFVKENVLMRHDTLPLGEFAIGTNTTAYVVAKKYGVEEKFPILIAEKMGPHFAVGDTCYSHQEEVKVWNPDGKEVVARDNEVSLLREEDSMKAYFNCHTDITIPYNELGALDAVLPEGEEIPIIREGRFVLAGTEELNEALKELE